MANFDELVIKNIYLTLILVCNMEKLLTVLRKDNFIEVEE